MTRDHRRICCNRDTVAAEVLDGEAVILNLATGAYYSLEQVGARIWEWIEQGRSEAEMARLLVEQYSVPFDEAAADLSALVTTLVEEHLVVLNAGGSPPTVDGVAATGSRLPYLRPELRKFTEMADMLALDPPLPGLKDIPWKDTSKE